MDEKLQAAIDAMDSLQEALRKGNWKLDNAAKLADFANQVDGIMRAWEGPKATGNKGEGMSSVRIVKMAAQYLEELRNGVPVCYEDLEVALDGLKKLEVAVHNECPVIDSVTGKKRL